VPALSEQAVVAGGPVAALRSVLAEALQRPPCVVSFSGGRDSSGLLGVAVEVARQEGLDLPVPATLVFPGDAAADEEQWQRAVLGHLRLEQWERIEVAPGQLDAVGPVAARVMRRHGLLWPFNVHFHVPVIERAKGGTVVTGFGGDELGRASGLARAERLLARRERVPLLDMAKICGLALAPSRLRTVVFARRFENSAPWLSERGVQLARSAFAEDEASVPFGFDRRLHWFWRSRYVQVCMAAFTRMGEPYSARVLHPFVSAPFLAALARRGGFPGLGDRADMVRLLFGGVLPPEALCRVSKASFTNPLWTGTARAFASAWSGRGIDHDLVDAGALREQWQAEQVNPSSTTLLQQAWLATDRASNGAVGGRVPVD
jgi:asparagine synthase (glutamine-hydrolysing)